MHRGDLLERDVTVFEGVRVVGVATAIAGATAQGVGTALVSDAIDRARRLGWITTPTAAQLAAALETRP